MYWAYIYDYTYIYIAQRQQAVEVVSAFFARVQVAALHGHARRPSFQRDGHLGRSRTRRRVSQTRIYIDAFRYNFPTSFALFGFNSFLFFSVYCFARQFTAEENKKRVFYGGEFDEASLGAFLLGQFMSSLNMLSPVVNSHTTT